ncbi:MAG: hypothetical protein HYY03_07040 [Chloroflexi bacterium]|nr:hypothetical protein [Chloroflexota bacterium]
MTEFLQWWAGIEAVGLVAFPLAFSFFRRLPDRGFAFSKVVGLLLLGYGLWTGAIVGLFPNSRGSVLLLLAAIAGLSLFVAGRHRQEMAGYLRSGWRYIAFVEVMFLAVLAGALFLRSFVPEINSGEKPFELAFLNSISRSESFPPPDPWLAGHSISYYYFGYVMVAALSKLVAVGASVSFNLGLSLMAALASVAAFGLVYNLIAAGRSTSSPQAARGPALWPRALLFGLAAAGLMLIVSNLEGVFELMARHGVGSRGFYGLVGVYGLDGPYDCAAAPGDCAEWYPTRWYWWWWATRMGSAWDIQEFPFFSLHFGDLHAHVLAMPFLIALFAAAFQTIAGTRSEGAVGDTDALDIEWPLRHPGRFLLLALLVGGIAFIDAWTLPLAVTMTIGAAIVTNWLRCGGRPLRALVDSAGFAAPVLVAAFIFYLPYYLHLEAGAGGLDVTRMDVASAVPPESRVTRPLHFLLFWGPLMWLALSFVAAYVRGRWRALVKPPLLALAVLAWAAPVGLWVAVIAFGDGPGAVADELSARGANLITIGILAASVTAVTSCFLREMRRRPDEEDSSQLFSFYLAGFAFLMLLGAELFFVNDLLGWRANTVFRFWHQTWIILSVVGAFGAYRLTSDWRFPWPWRVAWGRLAWLGVSVVILGAALVYPVSVIFDRSGGFRNPQALDGLAFVQRDDPLEYEAMTWLDQNVTGTPVILEAADPDGDFKDVARVSSRTGLPTVIGWPCHEAQWRGKRCFQGPAMPYAGRVNDVATIYTTTDVGLATSLLEKYDVQYVYVGRLERGTYGEGGLAKFGEFMEPVFQNEAVTIYRMPQGTARASP